MVERNGFELSVPISKFADDLTFQSFRQERYIAQLSPRMADGIRDGRPASPGSDLALTRHRVLRRSPGGVG
jgi:hypothetical protein